MNEEIVIGFDRQGRVVQYMPMSSGVLRIFAQELVRLADGAVVPPNVRPAEQEAPDEA